MPPTIESQIERAADELMGGGAVNTISRHRVEHVLQMLAHRVKQDAEAEVLLSLLTAEDVARQLGCSSVWVRTRARQLQKSSFPVGWRVPNTHTWLFRPQDVDRLRSTRGRGRPAKAG